jgi:non-canonical purine NTP pyrophosphatase (RdgB/HAM1 family)
MPEQRLPFVFVSGNPHKKREVERILGRSIETCDVDLPEIQSNDLVEVLAAKGESAWRHLGKPLVVEETGLDLRALGGFPGPLIKWMLARVGAEGVAKTAIALNDPAVVARCALLYRDRDGEVVAEGSCEGDLVLPPRGAAGFGWDPVLVPSGQVRTCAELGEAIKDRIGHRGRAWGAFREALLEQRGITF